MAAIRFNIADYQAKKHMCWPKRVRSITPLPPNVRGRSSAVDPTARSVKASPYGVRQGRAKARTATLPPIEIPSVRDTPPPYPNRGLTVKTDGLCPRRKPRCASSNHPLALAPFRKTRLAYVPARDLPPMGWIQCCLFCESPTTRLERAGPVRGYCCGHCKRQFGDRDIGRSIRNMYARIQ